MRATLLTIIGIHGIIHLFGFLEAFNIIEFEAISEPISKPHGIIWLMAFILFSVALILNVFQQDYWWLAGIVGVVISQAIIAVNWNDAKFGTLLNIFILISILMAFSAWNFEQKVSQERKKLLAEQITLPGEIITKQDIAHLPNVVQNWLKSTGILDKSSIFSAYLEQELLMLMKPGQKKWMEAKASQVFTVEPPAFNWSVNLKMNAFTKVLGRDKFENGEAEMIIKLFSIMPIVNIKKNKKVNQAALQRYLAEIIWFPSAAVSPYIQWEAIDDHSAKATMNCGETSGSGFFYFDDDGNFKKYAAMRYKDADDSHPTEWTVAVIRSQTLNGIKIPVEAKVSWKLPEGDWTWLQLRVTKINYS